MPNLLGKTPPHGWFPRMRSNLLPRLSIALAMLAVFTTIALTASSRPAEALTNCTVANLSVDAEEAHFLELINDYRGAGDELTISVHLNRSASWMAVDLATRSDNVFSHTDSLGRSHRSTRARRHPRQRRRLRLPHRRPTPARRRQSPMTTTPAPVAPVLLCSVGRP